MQELDLYVWFDKFNVSFSFIQVAGLKYIISIEKCAKIQKRCSLTEKASSQSMNDCDFVYCFDERWHDYVPAYNQVK